MLENNPLEENGSLVIKRVFCMEHLASLMYHDKWIKSILSVLLVN